MRRSVVTVILGVTLVVVGGLAFWLLPRMTGWQPFWARPATPVPAAPPAIPAAESPQSSGPAMLVSTAKITPAQVEAAWEPLAAVAQEGGWTAWTTVADANTGDVVFESDSRAHTPASLLKVLTAYTALSVLDPTDRLTTGVSQSGDQLYLWGQGDLLLSAGKGDSSATNGHAGLADLANKVSQNLQDPSAAFTLNYQTKLFADDVRRPGVLEQNKARWIGEIGPFAIDTGRVDPDEYYYYYDNSPGRVAEVFAALLEDQGIRIGQTVGFNGVVPEDSTVVGEVQSATVAEQVRVMLEVSDNTLAEQYCHLAASRYEGAPADSDSSRQVVKDILQLSDIDTQGLVMADCSGLDDNTKVAASTLLQTLQASLRPGAQAASLTRFLPIGGMSGTLKERFQEGAALGNLVGKTGALGQVSSLVGIGTTESGQHLYIVVGVDDVPDDGAWEIRPYVDDFVVRVLEN